MNTFSKVEVSQYRLQPLCSLVDDFDHGFVRWQPVQVDYLNILSGYISSTKNTSDNSAVHMAFKVKMADLQTQPHVTITSHSFVPGLFTEEVP